MPCLLATLLMASLLGCNKGRSIIDDARKLHDKGDVKGAVAELERVQKEASNTPEVEQARDLAVRWTVEAFDQGKTSPRGSLRSWLDEALRWSPSSGPARARLCKLLVDQEQWDEARMCLDVELSKAANAPSAIVSQARAGLLAHDEETERAKWLASADPSDWRSLMRKYPASTEAKAADERLLRSESLCANLDAFTRSARAELVRQRQIVPRFRQETNKAPAFFRIRIDAGKKAEQMQSMREAVLAHNILKGEESLQQAWAQILTWLAQYDQLLHDEMEKGVDEGLLALASWDDEIDANRRFEPAIGALESECKVVLGLERHRRAAALIAQARALSETTAIPSGTRATPTLAPTVLASGQAVPVGVRVDAVNVYWVNMQNMDSGSVMKLSKSGGAPVVLAQEQNVPLGLAVDSTTVYWAAGPAVRKVNISGGRVTTLYTTPSDGVIGRLVLDDTTVYFDASTGELFKVTKSGARGGPIGGGRNDVDTDFFIWDIALLKDRVLLCVGLGPKSLVSFA